MIVCVFVAWCLLLVCVVRCVSFVVVVVVVCCCCVLSFVECC